MSYVSLDRLGIINAIGQIHVIIHAIGQIHNACHWVDACMPHHSPPHIRNVTCHWAINSLFPRQLELHWHSGSSI